MPGAEGRGNTRFERFGAIVMWWLVCVLFVLQGNFVFDYCVREEVNLVRKDARLPVRGTLRWVYSAGVATLSRPVLGEKAVYFLSRNYLLHAVDISRGELLWKKDISAYVDSSVEVFLLVYSGRVILLAPQGVLYAFDAQTAALVWGPVFLREGVSVSPVICGGALFVATSGKGLLWVLNPENGGLVLYYPLVLHVPVFAQFLVEADPLRENANERDAGLPGSLKQKSLFDFQVYFVGAGQLLQVRISLRRQYYVRLADFVFPLKETLKAVSDPYLFALRRGIVTRKLLFVVLNETLFAVDLVSHRLAWAVSLKENLFSEVAEITRGSPLVFGHLIVAQAKAYHLVTGRTQWHLWLDVERILSAAVSESFLYLVGRRKKDYRGMSFFALVGKYGNVRLWVNVFADLLPFITVGKDSVFLMSVRGDLFAYV